MVVGEEAHKSQAKMCETISLINHEAGRGDQKASIY